MSGAEFPFQMIGRVPVVTAPAEIDITTSGELRAILFQWHSRGHTRVVLDLTGTEYCDMAGLRELLEAHQRAVANGGGLVLVTPAEGLFLRVLTITGVDGVIPHFGTVEQALARVPAAAGPRRRGPAREPAAAPASPPAFVRQRGCLIAEGRRCEQCGAVFVPVGERVRFCTSDCQAIWNREHPSAPAIAGSALIWSIAAMSDATARLPKVKAWDRPQALAAIGEAVWWITMLDATLIRHHPRAYDSVMTEQSLANRLLINETLAGLRFAENCTSRECGLSELVQPGAGTTRITGWTWNPAPEPALAWLPPPARASERERYRAYQVRLAGHSIGETIGRAVTFVKRTGANATSSTDTS